MEKLFKVEKDSQKTFKISKKLKICLNKNEYKF